MFPVGVLLLLGGLFGPVSSDSRLQDLFLLVENIASLGNTELNVVSDFSLPDQTRLLAMLSEAGIPVYVYDLEALVETQARDFSDEPCPTFGIQTAENYTVDMGHHHIHVRRHIMPTHKHHRSIFLWTSDSNKLLEAVDVFDKSVLWCDQRKEPGIYNAGSRFYFYVNSNDSAVSTVLMAGQMKKHARVAAIQKLPDGKFAFWGYNFFSDGDAPAPVVNFIWSKDSKALDVSSLFTSMKDFMGRTFDVHTMPWGPFVFGDLIDDEDGGNATNRYTNYWGFEMEMLWALQRTLNFNYTVTNPEDGLWGLVTENGTWNGMVAEAADGRAEIIISDILTPFIRNQVIQPSVFYAKDFLCFSSPPPVQGAKLLALLSPYDNVTWATIGGCVLLMSLVFWAVSKAEGSILGGPGFLPWADPSEAIWYNFGTLLGESITRDTHSERSLGLRCVLGAWIMYTVVIVASYGGNLKAFLTTPSYSEPITTLKGILESGLPWNMVLYGEEEEIEMARSSDPVIRAIWEGKNVIEFNPTPPLEGVYAGKEVMIDWQSGIEGAIYVKYSTPDGKPLVYLSPEPLFYGNWVCFGFNKLNPWVDRFNQVISRMTEAGLVTQWEKWVWVRMRAEARERGEEELVLDEREELSPLTMDDIQGLFYIAALALVVAGVFFLGELAWSRCSDTATDNRDDRHLKLMAKNGTLILQNGINFHIHQKWRSSSNVGLTQLQQNGGRRKKREIGHPQAQGGSGGAEDSR